MKPAPQGLLFRILNPCAPGDRAAPACCVSRRPLQSVFLLGALFLTALGLVQRMALPGVLLWDPDSWGYLAPVLTWRDHGIAQQIGSRDGFYPALLAMLLSIGSGMEFVARAQQVIGGLSILILAWIWRTFWGTLPSARWIDWLGLVAGTLLLLLYALNPVTLFYELSLRPEGVFAFFGLLQLLAVSRFLVASHGNAPGWRTVAWGAAAVVLAYSCVRLKPSWALAGILTSLPVLLVPVLDRRRLRAALLSLAFGLAGVATVSVALRSWMSEDPNGKSFLPATLLTIHADIIAREWRRSDAHPDLLPLLEQELAIAAKDPGGFKRLGFNPDYLYYTSPLFWKIAASGRGEDDIRKLCFQAYREAWTGSTPGMLAKISRQMGYFAFPERRDLAPNKIGLSKELALTLSHLTTATFPPSDAGLLARSVTAASAAPAASIESPRPLRAVYGFLAASSPWLPLIFLLGVFLGPLRRSGLVTASILAGVFYSAALGNAVMVAVIHALDLERYRYTYMPFLVLSLVAMLVLLIAAAGLRAGKSLPQPPQEP